MSDIFQEDIFSSSLEELQSRENVVCAYVQLEGGKHRNHFLSDHIITLILVMSNAFETISSEMMTCK